MPFQKDIAAMSAAALGCAPEEILPLLETPAKPEMGDYALPCFRFAKTMRMAPALIAQKVAAAELPASLEKAEAVNGYVNFFVKRAHFAQTILERVKEEGAAYGSANIGRGRTVCIDYSSINIAKPCHIGHLSSTAIGHALYNLYGFMGYRSVGINHLGDWGTQFGKLIAAYRHWGEGLKLEETGVDGLVALYVRFHEEAEQDESLNEEAREWFRKIEQGDAYALELFALFREVTLKEVMRVYDLLGVKFDSYAGESFYNDKLDAVVEELEQKELLVQSEGAQVVDLSECEMPPCIIRKSDGASLYATRDIAAALYRKKEYDFAKCLYVVAYQQNLHFKQWFKVVERMGYDWSKDLEHVAFGMVSMEDGSTLSTRKGKIIKLEEVLNKSIERANEILKEKSPDLEDSAEVAKAIGVGAVVFGVLHNARIKDISFSYDRALSFDGETAPYVQYTHARCGSVLRKADGAAAEPDYSALTGEFAWPVVTLLAGFGDAVLGALQKNEPYLVTRHIVALAQAFNRFYYEVRILDEDQKATAARLELVKAVKTVIATGLGLLGITAPERM